MTTELILILLIAFTLTSKFVTGAKETFRTGVPKLAIRLEKHLITGYLFSIKAGEGTGFSTPIDNPQGRWFRSQ